MNQQESLQEGDLLRSEEQPTPEKSIELRQEDAVTAEKITSERLFEEIQGGKLVAFANQSSAVEAAIKEDENRWVILGKIKEGIIDTTLAVGERTAGAALGYELATRGVGQEAGTYVMDHGVNVLLKKVVDLLPTPPAPEHIVDGWNTFGNIFDAGKNMVASGTHAAAEKSVDVVTQNILGPALGPLMGRLGTFFGTGALVGAGVGLYREYRRGNSTEEMQEFVEHSDGVIGDAEKMKEEKEDPRLSLLMYHKAVLENPAKYGFETKPDGKLADSEASRTLILAVRRAKINILRGKMNASDDDPLADAEDNRKHERKRRTVEQFLDDQGKLAAADREAAANMVRTFDDRLETELAKKEFDDPRSFINRSKAYASAVVNGAFDGSNIGLAWKLGKGAVSLGVSGVKWAGKIGMAVPTGGLSLAT